MTTEDIKFCLILAYYDRPRMVRNALESIRDQDYTNWFLTFIDDGSKAPGGHVVEEILGEKLGQFKSCGYSAEKNATFREYEKGILYRLEDTPEIKAAQNGTRHPEFMNYGVLEVLGAKDSDVVAVICDDDGLYPGALQALNDYYTVNPAVGYSYHSLAVFDPFIEKPNPEHANREFWLNHRRDVPSAFCVCDSSQVTYRRMYFTQHGVRYPNIAGRALDAHLYGLLQNYDICRFNGLVGAYKGSFSNQLSYRISPETEYYPIDTEI